VRLEAEAAAKSQVSGSGGCAVNNVDVLVLHGSPGSGRSTLSGATADPLRESGLANAVIELDDLTMVYPDPERSFARNNLRAIWPNYAAIAGLRLVIPSVIADEDERVQLRAAVPGSRFVICELTAPETVLKNGSLHDHAQDRTVPPKPVGPAKSGVATLPAHIR
jgi:hypothetical protein